MTEQQPARAIVQPKDNLVGVCNALGEDFGFNPLWLRLTLGSLFLFVPVGVVLVYVALGIAVLVSRLVLPTPKRHMRISRAEVPAAAVNEAVDEMVFAKAA